MEIRALHPNYKTRKRPIRIGLGGYKPFHDYEYFYHEFVDPDDEQKEWLNEVVPTMGEKPESFGYQHLIDQGPCGCWSYLRQRENMDWTPHIHPSDDTDSKWKEGRDPQETELAKNEQAFVYAACCINEDILLDNYMDVNGDKRNPKDRPQWHNVKDLGCCNHKVAEYQKQDGFHWKPDPESLSCCQSVACYNTLFAMIGLVPILIALFMCRVKSDEWEFCGCNPWSDDNKCCGPLDRSKQYSQYKAEQKHLQKFGGNYHDWGQFVDTRRGAYLPSYSNQDSGSPFGMAM